MDGAPSRRDLLRQVAGRPALRHLALGFVLFRTSELGAWIAVTTLAHSAGGVAEVSAVAVAQLAPAAVAALAVGRLAARFGPRTVLVRGLATQAVALAVVATSVGFGAPRPVTYGAAVVAAVAVVTSRPTMTALLPTTVADPRELIAANSLVGMLDGTSTLVGPVLVAASIGTGVGAAPFALTALLAALGATATSFLPAGPAPGAGAGTGRGDDAAEPVEPVEPVVAARTDRRGMRALLAVLAAYSLLIGTLDILFVVVAVDLTGGPPARVAWLNAAFGVGALVGGAASAALAGRDRLWPTVAGSSLSLAALLATLSLTSGAGTAALALAGCGVASGVLFVSARTLLQRVCDLASLCRAFAFAEASEMALLLVGAIVVPLAVGTIGERAAPAGIAAVMALLFALTIGPVVAAERRVAVPREHLALLASDPLLAPLPAPVLETLAREARPRVVEPGGVVIRQGEPGHEYFVVAAGRLVVARDGEVLTTVGPGCGVGELALLFDQPRAATVVAAVGSRLLAIDRRPFLVAMTNQALDRLVLPPGDPSGPGGAGPVDDRSSPVR